MRNRAYDALVQKLREVNPVADRETVIRKINTLRTAFRREYKKVRSSQRMVKNPRHRYRSSLWYYDILKFVVEQNEPRVLRGAVGAPPNVDEERCPNDGSMQPDGSQEEMSIQSDIGKVETASPLPSPSATPLPNFQPVILETEGTYGRRFGSPSMPDTSRRKYQSEIYQDHQPKETICEVTPKQYATCHVGDDFDTFGHYVASKLRKSVPRQSIIAEKLIADVLLRANLGILDENTCLSDKVPPRCFLVTGDS